MSEKKKAKKKLHCYLFFYYEERHQDSVPLTILDLYYRKKAKRVGQI